jgi:DNA-binding NtrC family response regulator
MQDSIFTVEVNQALPLRHTTPFPEHSVDAALDNRIEALRMLVLAVLREISALREAPVIENCDQFDLRHEVHRFEAAHIRYALIRTGGRQRRAAQLLNMKVATLNAKIKRYHLDEDELINSASSLR